jgi:hypothetical protein
MKLARGQRCQICTHPQRKQIELCVIETDNKKATALKFGLNLHSLAHHFLHHVPKAIERAAVARKIKLGDNMLEEIEKLHETTLQILTEARRTAVSFNGVPVLVGGKPVMVRPQGARGDQGSPRQHRVDGKASRQAEARSTAAVNLRAFASLVHAIRASDRCSTSD